MKNNIKKFSTSTEMEYKNKMKWKKLHKNFIEKIEWNSRLKWIYINTNF